MKKSAHRLRHEFLCDREDLAPSQKTKKEISNIRRHEETRRIWRAINRSQGKSHGQGISKVDIKVDGEWTTVTDCKKVEPAIMTNNSKRFNLTLPTPMMSKNAVKKIGYLAEKKYASEVLEGKHVYDPRLDAFTNKFLTFIGKHPSLSPFKGDVMRNNHGASTLEAL